LGSVLTSVKQFLEENPYEIITINLENYVKAPELDKTIRSVNGIEKLIFKPGEWYPVKENGWPTLGWMVENSKRLLIFNSLGGSQLTFSMWHYFAATTWGSVNIDYLVNNLRNVPKPNRPLYLFAAALAPSAPIPVLKDGTFAEQARHAITHLNETTDNINFNYTNSTVLSQLIESLKEKYGRIPTSIAIDHIEQGDALEIAYNINKQSIADKAFREKWFGPFPHVRK
jgi:hypothetical protein